MQAYFLRERAITIGKIQEIFIWKLIKEIRKERDLRKWEESNIFYRRLKKKFYYCINTKIWKK